MWKCQYRWHPLSDLQPALTSLELRLTKGWLFFLFCLFIYSGTPADPPPPSTQPPRLAACSQYPLIKPVTLSLTVTLKMHTKVTLCFESKAAHQCCLSLFLWTVAPFFYDQNLLCLRASVCACVCICHALAYCKFFYFGFRESHGCFCADNKIILWQRTVKRWLSAANLKSILLLVEILSPSLKAIDANVF